MRYTLEQACERLGHYGESYGVTDSNLVDTVNAAVQALAGLNGWERLRKVVRFFSACPEFALPQGCAGLVRACVNGRPVTMRGQDFRFLQSGPGDEFTRPSSGFSLIPPKNIENDGYGPLIFAPDGEFRLVAFSDRKLDETAEPAVTVRGIDRTGRSVTRVLGMKVFAEYNDDGTLVDGTVEPDDAEFDETVFSEVTEVVLGKNAGKYVTLYAKDGCGDVMKVARYHPSVRVPLFRHYHISGLKPGCPIEILAEVRVDPLPLVSPDDVLPFDGVEPIEYMIMYMWKMKSGEVDAARKYKEEAASWLKAQEVADDTVQTSLVVNMGSIGTMGRVSNEAFNI